MNISSFFIKVYILVLTLTLWINQMIDLAISQSLNIQDSAIKVKVKVSKVELPKHNQKY